MTPSERREASRLRSERWRRAHGIMPRRPAQRPWLAMGISRSTWYIPDEGLVRNKAVYVAISAGVGDVLPNRRDRRGRAARSDEAAETISLCAAGRLGFCFAAIFAR